MILLPTDKLYYNTRTWYSKNFLKEGTVSSGSILYNGYRSWLLEQGAVLTKFKFKDDLRVTDIFGVAPGYDQFEFKYEEDATAFILRWS